MRPWWSAHHEHWHAAGTLARTTKTNARRQQPQEVLTLLLVGEALESSSWSLAASTQTMVQTMVHCTTARKLRAKLRLTTYQSYTTTDASGLAAAALGSCRGLGAHTRFGKCLVQQPQKG